VASRQWGNITTRQLRAIGFSSREVWRMVEAAVYGQLPVRDVIEVTAPTQRRGDARSTA
jgi:hypothetical protein